MNTTYLILLFTTSCVATWVFLILFYMYHTSRKRLIENGYPTAYIEFLKKDYRKRSIGIAVAIPLLLGSAYSMYWLIFGIPESHNRLLLIFIIFLVLVLPFPILDLRRSRKEYKKLAIETQSEIIIDLKHKVLHQIFNPLLESIFFILFLIYYFSTRSIIPPIVFIHLVIPWLIYFSARNSKFLTRPLMKDGYFLMLAVISLNYLIVWFYIYRYSINCIECADYRQIIASISLMIILMLKILYSVYQFLRTRRFYADEPSER